MTETQPPAGPDPLIGLAIGNYVVRDKLGEGGMGSVYWAEHPAIGKRVAVKVLHPDFAAQPEIVHRFFNEAKTVNDIQHPNIVDILDFGMFPAAAPGMAPLVYFLMEYIEGESLSALIRREAPLRADRAAAIALQIGDALAASHRKGVVHRDLKPDNVMLVARGRGHDIVKLLDFGIAKLTGNAASTHRTRTGIVMGTPQYMSPEQCEGRSDIDHRTDIYALGIVVYQMLTGRVPFVGESFGEVLVQQMATPPLAPSVLVPQIPVAMEQIVLKALEKRAADRYAHMDDLLAALQEPARYVEQHGGAGFLTSPPLRDPSLVGARAAFARVATSPGQAPATTLSGSASAIAADGAPARRGKGRTIGLVVAAMVVGGVAVAVVSSGGGGTVAPAAAPPAAAPLVAAPLVAAPLVAAPPPAAAPPAAPEPAAPAAAPAPAVTAPPARVTIAIDSSPGGAQVFVGSERSARGTTPCEIALDRGGDPVEIRLVRAGYRPLRKAIDRGADARLSVTLERVSGASPAATTRPPPSPPATKPIAPPTAAPPTAAPPAAPPAAAPPAAAPPAAASPPAAPAPAADKPKPAPAADDSDNTMDPFKKKAPP